MKASGCQSSVVPNLYELGELPFLKREVHQLTKFKDKEKFVPVIRSLTYLCKTVLSKVLVYSLGHTTKDKKTSRFL